MPEDRDYHNQGCVNLSTLLLLVLALPAAVRAWRADRPKLPPSESLLLPSECGACGRKWPHGWKWDCWPVPVRSKDVDPVSRETTAVFPAAGGAGHPALSRVPLPASTECHGS